MKILDEEKMYLYLDALIYYSDMDYSKWLCVIDGEIYTSHDLHDKFGYDSEYEAALSGNFIEFDKVSIIELQKKYLKIAMSSRELKNMENLSDKDFYINFNIYIDQTCDYRSWGDFEKKALNEAFEKWRKKNHLFFK